MSYNLSKVQIAWVESQFNAGKKITSIPSDEMICWEEQRDLFIKKTLGIPDDFWELYRSKDYSNEDGVTYDGYGNTYNTLMEHIKDTLFVYKSPSDFKRKMKDAIRSLKQLYDEVDSHIEIIKEFDIDGIQTIMDIYITTSKRPWWFKHDGRSANSYSVRKENQFMLENIEEKIINDVFNKLDGWFRENPFPKEKIEKVIEECDDDSDDDDSSFNPFSLSQDTDSDDEDIDE